MNKPIEDIRGTDTAELRGRLADLRKEQFELRFHGAGDGSGATRTRVVRRTIARILTILGERERAAAAGAHVGGKPSGDTA